MRHRHGSIVRGSLGVLALWTGAARAADLSEARGPGEAPAASVSVAAGTLLPLTLSPRVNAERAAVAVMSGYDGARASATLATTADVELWGPLALRAGFTYLPNAELGSFQPHAGLRVQLLRQARHGIDGALGAFYRMERFTEDEGLVQVVSSLARRFEAVSLFANFAYGQDPEGDDRDGEVRLAAQHETTSRLKLGMDGRLRFDLFSTDTRRAMRGWTDLDFAVGPIAAVTLGRFAVVAQAGVSGVRAGALKLGPLATMGVASVF